MSLDPSTGPISREKFKELIDAPFGAAAKEIRKFDPLFGRAEGKTVKWRVTVQRDSQDQGIIYVDASSEEEALTIAEEANDSDVDWDYDNSGFTAIRAEAKP